MAMARQWVTRAAIAGHLGALEMLEEDLVGAITEGFNRDRAAQEAREAAERPDMPDEPDEPEPDEPEDP
jgi:hypothetical protein